MKENIKFLDIHLRSGGYRMLAYYTMWILFTMMVTGLSIIISASSMRFYGALFEAIF